MLIADSGTRFNRIAGNSMGIGPAGSVWGRSGIIVQLGASDNVIGTNGDGAAMDWKVTLSAADSVEWRFEVQARTAT